ncbi:MAG TPA: LpqB family beta-propeller domain-containing protein, partial [Rubrobacter sp.]|nr:LpqB family beta-propeller domain-containing protein [Rubrobacter sp.]
RVDPGLGPGTRALSSGPGYKGSPSWSPGGGRIAFTVDGYVVDRPAGPGDLRRWTTRDFVAEDTEWISDDTLTMLGAPSATEATPSSVYRARAGKNSLELEKVARGVMAMSIGSEGLILALGTGTHESALALAHGSGEVYRLYTDPIEGDVTSLSPSPDGDAVVLALRPPGDLQTSELRVFDLLEGKAREITRLDGNREILGTPQWTKHGVYFVAGKKDTSLDDDGAEPLYNLYRTSTESGAPELAPGVGEDFVAASIRVSPEGERVAVIGRLNPKSPANLYVLDIHAQNLRAVTTNEDMEIKTGPDDLAWSPGGKSVAIVARGTPSTEPEVRAAPASSLLKDFYNLYEIPVEGTTR